MREKPMVTYQKQNIEISKPITYFNKYSIINTLFEHPFEQVNSWDFYSVNKGISKIHLKNVTFYRDIKFICPKNTTLILENCQFNGANLYFFGGNIQLINPKLPSYYYCNNISGAGLESFSTNIKDEYLIDLNLHIKANKINIDGEKRIRNICLNGQEITLKNISQINSMSLFGEKIIVKNSRIKTFDPPIKRNLTPIIINAKKIDFQNTTIYLDETLDINCNEIITDESSKIISLDEKTNYKKLIRQIPKN